MNPDNSFYPAFSKYQLALIFFLVLSSIIFFFKSTLAELLNQWLQFDESLGHGLLVLLVSAYLIFKGITWRDNSLTKPAYYASIPLMIFSVLWAISYSVDINIIQQLLIPLIFLASIYLFTGRAIVLKILIPTLLFYFAIPVWDYLNETLLTLTSVVVQRLVQYSNITAFIEGNSIFLPSGEILIASGCSGLRYFIIGLFLSVLSGYLYFERNLVRLALIVMGVLLSLLANWMRVYGITVIAYMTEMKSPLVANHETLGWVLFMLFMLPLFYINYRYQSQLSPDKNKQQPSTQPASYAGVLALVLFIFAIGSGPVIANIYSTYEYQGSIPMPQISKNTANSESLYDSNLWAPNISSPDIKLQFQNKMDNHIIHTLVYGYKRSLTNKEILPYTSNIYNRDTWAVKQQESLRLDIADNRKESYKKLILANKYSEKRVVLYYNYDVGGYETDTYNVAKLLQIPATLSGNAYARINFVWSECNEDCQQISNVIQTRFAAITDSYK